MQPTTGQSGQGPADSQAGAFIQRRGALVQMELDALDPAELRGLGQAAIGQLLGHVHLRGDAPRRAARPRGAAGPAEQREQLTPTRSAGRIESELWEAFLSWARSQCLSNTDGLRRLIQAALGMPEPAPLGDAGSGVDQVAAS